MARPHVHGIDDIDGLIALIDERIRALIKSGGFVSVDRSSGCVVLSLSMEAPAEDLETCPGG